MGILLIQEIPSISGESDENIGNDKFLLHYSQKIKNSTISLINRQLYNNRLGFRKPIVWDIYLNKHVSVC